MSDFLAIDLEPRRICGVEGTVERGSVKIRKSFSLPVPESISVDDPQGLGEWLKGELRRKRVSAGQVCVSLPREAVIVRHIEAPDVSDDELPDLVRYQAAAKSTIPLDHLTLDFLPLPRRTDATVRDVLVATVHQDRVKRLRTIATAAGLELKSVGVSSVATAALVALEEQRVTHEEGEVSVVIAQHGDRVEISILGGAELHFTHSTQVLPGDSQQSPILAEISRALVALQKRLPASKAVRCWLIGSPDENAKLGDAVRERFQCEIRQLDPFRAQGVVLDCSPVDDPHGAFGGPIGQLVSQSMAVSCVIDFLSPRRPTAKKDYSRIRKLAAVAAAAVLFGAMFGYRSYAVASLKKQVDSTEKDEKDQLALLKELAPQVKVADAVGDWAAGRVNWLKEADSLAQAVDGTDRHYLTKIQFGEGTRNELGTVTASGHAKERFDIEGLNAGLMQRPDLEVNAKPIKKSGRDGDYPQQFDLDLKIKLKLQETTK
ncbi:MAG: pilus assembly protein PilM [Planctomycetota bacterium]|nr:pilus assembly protein PilM [Planctomycetota bacterium]